MFVTVHGQRIFFDVVGSKLVPSGRRTREKPTLLVLHGGPGLDHTSMRAHFDGFADIAQVIYLDHRGNGQSKPSERATWTLAQWGDDIHGFCQVLGIERPIVLGHCFGGMVAQSYVTRHPEHPRALILSSTAPRADVARSVEMFAERAGAEAAAIMQRMWKRGSDDDLADYFRVCVPLFNRHWRLDSKVRPRAVPGMDVFCHFCLPGGESHEMDFRAVLARIECPMLVLGGELDALAPVHLARELADFATAAPVELRIFANCGHGTYRDDPKRVLPVIRSFIEQTA